MRCLLLVRFNRIHGRVVHYLWSGCVQLSRSHILHARGYDSVGTCLYMEVAGPPWTKGEDLFSDACAHPR